MRDFLFKGILFLCTVSLFSGCATTTPTHPGEDAILWLQTAAEYRAAAMQSYESAERMLDNALADRSWTAAIEQESGYENLPPAVILDVDETVLDNSPFNAQLVRENRNFDPALWEDWVSRAAAEALPGAREFVEAAVKKGVTVFYITNRSCPRNTPAGECPRKDATLRNLVKRDFPAPDPSRMLLKYEKPEWGSEKAPRRSAVAGTHRILMIIGDDLGDFIPEVRRDVSPEQRRELTEQYRDRWGSRWFILPNPVYGSWRNILSDPKTGYLKGYR